MNITVDIDNDTMKSLLNKGIEAMTADECKDIVKQAMIKAFANCPDFKDMLIKNEDRIWGSGNSYRLGPLAEKMLESGIDGSEFKELKEKMVDDLKIHHREILENAIMSNIARGIVNDNVFIEQIEYAVQRVISENRNS